MKHKYFTTEFIEITKRLEKETRFWSMLENMGFNVDRDVVAGMSHIKHQSFPLSTSFYMDRINLKILKMTVETGCWAIPESDVLMSCDDFIKFQIFRIRRHATEALNKLDNVVL